MLLNHDSLTPKGTFWFFTGMSLLGLVFAWVFLPETSGKGLEETNKLYGESGKSPHDARGV